MVTGVVEAAARDRAGGRHLGDEHSQSAVGTAGDASNSPALVQVPPVSSPLRVGPVTVVAVNLRHREAAVDPGW